MFCLSVFKSWNTYAHFHINRGSNERFTGWEYNLFMLITFFLLLNLQNGNYLYANFLVYNLTIYRNCPLFQFLRHGIGIHIPILTGVQNGHFNNWKNGHISWKTFFWKLSFHDEDQLYPNCLFFIVTIYHKFLLF